MHRISRLPCLALGAASAALGPALASTLLACASPPPEGRVVASFEIVGSVGQNTCGPQAVELPDPWMRRAELRATDIGLYYWHEAGAVVQGSKSPLGEHRFRVATTRELLAPNAATGHPGCRVRLDDDLRFELEGGPGPDGGADGGAGYELEGTQTTIITILAGSDCTPLLNSAGQGGPFLALPCQFRYDLVGTEAGAP